MRAMPSAVISIIASRAMISATPRSLAAAGPVDAERCRDSVIAASQRPRFMLRGETSNRTS